MQRFKLGYVLKHASQSLQFKGFNFWTLALGRVTDGNEGYSKPIGLKFKTNPEIPILHVVNTMRTNFQSKILSPGLLPAI